MTSGHGGWHAISAAQAYGVQTLFTLSGAHIFPLFDAAVGGKDAVTLPVIGARPNAPGHCAWSTCGMRRLLYSPRRRLPSSPAHRASPLSPRDPE